MLHSFIFITENLVSVGIFASTHVHSQNGCYLRHLQNSSLTALTQVDSTESHDTSAFHLLVGMPGMSSDFTVTSQALQSLCQSPTESPPVLQGSQSKTWTDVHLPELFPVPFNSHCCLLPVPFPFTSSLWIFLWRCHCHYLGTVASSSSLYNFSWCVVSSVNVIFSHCFTLII